MKSHVLSSVSSMMEAASVIPSYYDFTTQISYMDQAHTNKVIQGSKPQWTKGTEAVEVSDPDSFMYNGPKGTLVTETVEDSDADNFMYSGQKGTVVTAVVEDSDADSFMYSVRKGTRQTNVIEESDLDNFM